MKTRKKTSDQQLIAQLKVQLESSDRMSALLEAKLTATSRALDESKKSERSAEHVAALARFELGERTKELLSMVRMSQRYCEKVRNSEADALDRDYHREAVRLRSQDEPFGS